MQVLCFGCVSFNRSFTLSVEGKRFSPEAWEFALALLVARCLSRNCTEPETSSPFLRARHAASSSWKPASSWYLRSALRWAKVPDVATVS